MPRTTVCTSGVSLTILGSSLIPTYLHYTVSGKCRPLWCLWAAALQKQAIRKWLPFRKGDCSNIHHVASSTLLTSRRDAICAREKMGIAFVANHYTCYTKWESALHAISLGLFSSLWKIVFHNVLSFFFFSESRACRNWGTDKKGIQVVFFSK